MTILEVIGRVDDLKPNTYTPEHKVDWLCKLDRMIIKNIIETHEGGEGVIFHDYNYDTDTDTELLAPPPYDEMYIRWLEAQIDLANSEYDKYNASIMLFNTEWQAYENHYHQLHVPKSGNKRFLF